ncbi:MAG TPA: hypothetical protein VLB44_24795, partial [Kofleriaceae bacterium]|nr:hypothetical protein [Kofleriaceae bacterium]
ASLAGGSVVSLLVGGLLHADAEGRNPREGTRCSPLPDGSVYCPTVGDAQKLQDNADSIDRMRLIGDTMLVAGTGLLVGAVVVYALAPRTTVALNVVATRHTSGVTFTARF